MEDQTPRRSGFAAPALITVALALLVPPLAHAQRTRGELRGKIIDTGGRVVVAHRVVFRAQGMSSTVISQPSGPDGEYSAAVPVNAEFTAVELVGPQGLRQPLSEQPVCKALPGARCEVHLGGPGAYVPPPPAAPAGTAPPPGSGATPPAAAGTVPPPVVPGSTSAPTAPVKPETPPAPPPGVEAPKPSAAGPATTTPTTPPPPKPPAAGAKASSAVTAPAPTPVTTPPAPPPAPPAEAAAAGKAAPVAPVPVVVTGKLIARDGTPLPGYRVVFREGDSASTELSSAATPDGSYTVSLTAGRVYRPVAVISPSGKRRDLLDEPTLSPAPGMSREIEADVSLAARVLPEPAFPGADRLFLSFVEDAVIVDRYRAEAQLEIADYDRSDVLVGRVIGAAQLDAIPQVEWGARIGVGDVDSGFGDDSGTTDLEVWGKLDLSDRESGDAFAFGFLLEFPTGEPAQGLGQDALATKVYAAGRTPLSWGVVTYNAGLRVSEDGRFGSLPLDAEVSVSFGGGLILPLEERFVGIVEVAGETERYDGLGADLRLLAGFNWLLGPRLVVRAASAIGFDDGGPEGQILAGVSWDF